MSRRAFTLIEMLLATVLSAVLLGALLTIAGRLANDRAHLAAQATVDYSSLQAFLDWDLRNAEESESISADRIDLLGHDAIDPSTLQPSFRAVAVTYELNAATHELLRRQRSIDDPSAAKPWESVIARHVKQMSISDATADNARFQLVLDDGTIEVSWRR